jgi:hypothetical protein
MQRSPIILLGCKFSLAFASIGLLLVVSVYFRRDHALADGMQQAPMDLVWKAGTEDPNGLPQNPRFASEPR